MQTTPVLTHEYAYMIYNEIKKERLEPTFWGEVLSKKEQILQIFHDLQDSYSGNSYMQGVVARMQKEIQSELRMIESKYENYSKNGNSDKLVKSSLKNVL